MPFRSASVCLAFAFPSLDRLLWIMMGCVPDCVLLLRVVLLCVVTLLVELRAVVLCWELGMSAIVDM